MDTIKNSITLSSVALSCTIEIIEETPIINGKMKNDKKFTILFFLIFTLRLKNKVMVDSATINANDTVKVSVKKGI